MVTRYMIRVFPVSWRSLHFSNRYKDHQRQDLYCPRVSATIKVRTGLSLRDRAVTFRAAAVGINLFVSGKQADSKFSVDISTVLHNKTACLLHEKSLTNSLFSRMKPRFRNVSSHSTIPGISRHECKALVRLWRQIGLAICGFPRTFSILRK